MIRVELGGVYLYGLKPQDTKTSEAVAAALQPLAPPRNGLKMREQARLHHLPREAQTLTWAPVTMIYLVNRC